MKSRIFSILALALILVTSLAVVGCGGGGGATFDVTGLTFSANPVAAGTAVTISATISNSGDSGTCNATLIINGATVNTTSVAVAAKATQPVSFTYTPTAEGSYNVSITPGYKAKGTLGVTKTPTGSWDVKYKLASGSRITLNYSLAGSASYHRVASLSAGDSIVTIRINQSVVNGARDITVLSSGWQLSPVPVKDISPGVSMNLTISLNADAAGKLYVQDGVGNVDMSSTSARSTKPKQTDTLATGNKAPAGSMHVALDLKGYAKVTVGNPVILPFGLTFTTGTTTNIVSIPSTKFNGATISSQGTPFAKDGALKVADYVGTAGTITTTGTGECLGLTLDGFPIDFQAEIYLVLEPVSAQ